MIKVKDLSYKTSPKFQIRNVSFSLEDGYMMALLGENGAGKTTLLELIYGTLKADSGEVVWNNAPLNKDEVAYVGAGKFLNEESMENNLSILEGLYPEFDKNEYERILKLFNITAIDTGKKYVELSTGFKMLFDIAFALSRHPKLVLMDEPLSNLDPIIKIDLLELLKERIDKENLSVIMSTHLIEEISDMVDYIGIINKGSLIEFGDRESLFEKYDSDDLRDFATLKEGK